MRRVGVRLIFVGSGADCGEPMPVGISLAKDTGQPLMPHSVACRDDSKRCMPCNLGSRMALEENAEALKRGSLRGGIGTCRRFSKCLSPDVRSGTFVPAARIPRRVDTVSAKGIGFRIRLLPNAAVVRRVAIAGIAAIFCGRRGSLL